jgi:hypothetical protein
MRYAYDKNKALVGKGYALSSNSFDPSASSTTTQDREQQDLDNYACNRLANYMSNEGTSSDFENELKNLVRD